MGLHQPNETRRLLYVLADGKLREEVPETTEGAALRIVKDDAGNIKAEKWELTYPGITGFVTGVTKYDGEYGTNINVLFKDENEEEFTVSLKAKSRYGEDFLHKLPNLNFEKEVTLKPYNFTTDDGKDMRGVSLVQDDVKLTNAFNWKNGDEWKSVDGYPQVDEKKKPKNSDQWSVFFTQRREWVIDHLIEKGLLTEPTNEEDVPF